MKHQACHMIYSSQGFLYKPHSLAHFLRYQQSRRPDEEHSMIEGFGIPQLTEYLTRTGLKMARIDREQELIELAFHSSHGQWRIIVGIQQSGEAKKLMLIAPHMGVVTAKRRLECLEG